MSPQEIKVQVPALPWLEASDAKIFSAKKLVADITESFKKTVAELEVKLPQE